VKRKNLLKLVGAILLAGMVAIAFVPGCAAPEPAPAPAPAPAEPEVIKWTQQLLEVKQPPFGPYKPYVLMDLTSYGLEDWLEESTNGRIQIELLEPESVFPPTEGPTAVGAGAVDLFKGCAMHWAGLIPEMNVVGGMPGGHASIDEQHVYWYDYGVYEKIAPLYADYNVKFYPITAMENMNVMATFPLPHPDSVKGHKLRGPGPWGKYLALMGASPVSMPFSEMYMAIKLGTIDGALTGVHAFETAKLKEVITDFVTNPNPCLDCVLINEDSFNALPEDIQRLIDQQLPNFLLAKAIESMEQQAYMVAHAAADYGVGLWTWTPEEIKELRKGCIEEIWPEFAEGTPLCAELIEIMKVQMKDHGRL